MTTQREPVLLRAPVGRGEDADSPVSPPASPSPTSFRPQRKATKRKAAAQPIVNVAKRRVAERRRSLRNERMATIDYDELVRRLAELVEASPSIEIITLDEISKLYQVRPRPLASRAAAPLPGSRSLCRSLSATSSASCSR